MARRLSVHAEYWEAATPFRIAGREWLGFDLVVCEINDGRLVGRGEAEGIYFLGENVAQMLEQINSVAGDIETGASCEHLLGLLPPGGARNALDCALWDLEAKQAGTSAWALSEGRADPVTTMFTIGLEDTPDAMAAKAAAARRYPILKIKLDADRPVERVAMIRAVRPDAILLADINGGWTFPELLQWAPKMQALGLTMLEQPLARGADADLESYLSPLPLFADESCLHQGDLEQAARRYAGINIKLDKTGGLTEALRLALAAKQRGLRLMAGCMNGTSLAAAPAHVLAQRCERADLDAPLLLRYDRPGGLRYEGATVTPLKGGCWGI